MLADLKIDKNIPFIIYGAGEVGNNCNISLREHGYTVVAAIDKNKSGEHIVEGLCTYKLGEKTGKNDYKRTGIVIICLANGMLHKNVADQLYALGYQYIIFLPMNYCMQDKNKRKLTRLYNCVLQADENLSETVVKCYENYILPDLDIMSSVIRKDNKYITAWVRMEILFSESYELWRGDKSKVFGKLEIKDKNIGCNHPYENLFSYFSMNSMSCDSYFTSRCEEKSEEEKKCELINREKLYLLFMREHDRGMDFFIEGAPEVIWNPRNYFNLVGGHHRTMFLLNEGHTLFPVKMECTDFDKWCNAEHFSELRIYLVKHKIKKLYAPCPHPGMINFPVECDDVGKTKLKSVLYFLADKNIATMSVLDCGYDEGYFARNLERIGAKKVLFISDNTQQTELANLLNRVLYREKVIVLNQKLNKMNSQTKYDIVFFTNLTIEDKSVEDILTILTKICTKYLFLEISNNENIKKILEGTRFNRYVCLHKEYRNGKVSEFGVYYE